MVGRKEHGDDAARAERGLARREPREERLVDARDVREVDAAQPASLGVMPPGGSS